MTAKIGTESKKFTRAEISLGHLRNNLSIVKTLVGHDVKIMAMVKADAYGHGLYEISRELVQQGVQYLGVAFIEEAISLRNSGITSPILVVGALNTEQIPEHLVHDIELTSSSFEHSLAIASAARQMGKVANVHLKIDTGMERIGVNWYDAEQFIEQSFTLESVRVKGIWTHLAKAESDPGFTAEQLRHFDTIINAMEKKRLLPELIHCANSAGIINHRASHYSMVRPGIMLYGYNPNGYLPDVVFSDRKLKPVMSLKTKVSFKKIVPALTGISYNHTYTTKNQTRIVTLPLGYGDGYFRLLSNKSEVMVRGKKYPVVGTICMDQCMVDIGMNGNADIGDDVLLFGEMDGTVIPLEDLCQKIGTITYEFLCGITQRVPRIYLD